MSTASIKRAERRLIASAGVCCYCGGRFMPETTGKLSFTWQHIIPKRRGGTYAATNLRPCCKGCNTDLAHALVDDCPGALAALRARYNAPRGGLLKSIAFATDFRKARARKEKAKRRRRRAADMLECRA